MRYCYFGFGLMVTCLLSSLGAQEIRSLDGTGNHPEEEQLGAAHTPLMVLTESFFGDLIQAPNGATRPGPREISNTLFAQNGAFIPNERNLSDLAWVFGQFLDHDITFVEDNPMEQLSIPVPECDEFMDPNCTGAVIIPQSRSAHIEGTGIDAPRAYENSITMWIDASAVYGSDSMTCSWLRTYEDGKLHVSEFDLLPYNTEDKSINGRPDNTAPAMENPLAQPYAVNLMVSGDSRANENLFLTAMHTLFHVEHNRLCDEIIEAHPTWNDEQVFRRARKILSAKLQAITYYEWLPAIGVDIPPYVGYDPNVDPRVSNEFSAAAFRFGHNLLNNQLRRLNDQCESLNIGDVRLKDAFFSTSILYETGLDPVFKGMVSQAAQEFDTKVIDDVRNFLFVDNGSSSFGLDLVALNIMRGRERGLPDYNTMRRYLGLAPVKNFSEITADVERAQTLEELYEDVEDIDLWVGLLSEDHLSESILGESLQYILSDQFVRLRDGDRLYFENDPSFTSEEVEELKGTRMADIISRNTGVLVQDNAFFNDPICNIRLENEDVDFMDITVAPNPIEEMMKVTVFLRDECLASLQIFDGRGRLIRSEQKLMTKGYSSFNMFLETDLPAGMYFLKLTADERSKVCKVVKAN